MHETAVATDHTHIWQFGWRSREISGAASASQKALLGVSLMCPPGNERDRFPLFGGKYVIPFSSGNQNSRFPPICGSLVENVIYMVPKPLRSRPARPSRANPRIAAKCYIFHEATTNRWKTAILVSTGKGDDILSSKQWKTVLFVSKWAHEADTSKSFWPARSGPGNLPRSPMT
jgi:hypothetical protein